MLVVRGVFGAYFIHAKNDGSKGYLDSWSASGFRGCGWGANHSDVFADFCIGFSSLRREI